MLVDSLTSAEVGGSPGTAFSVARPIDCADCPFASGVPTVSVPELCSGGEHEPNESGAPWDRLGALHGSNAGTSDTLSGVAPFGRG
jgi:hypothetical protein